MFFTQILINTIVVLIKFLLIAVPINLIYSVSKTFNMAVGAVSVAIAYVFYSIFTSTHSYVLAVIGVLISVIIFAFIMFLLTEKLIVKKQHLLVLLITLSFSVLIEETLAIIYGSGGKILIKSALPVFHYGDLHITYTGAIMIIAGIFLATISVIIFQKTPFGRIFRSLSENESCLTSFGMNPKLIRYFIYVFALLLSSFVGVLVGLDTALTPYMGFNYIIMAFMIFLVGGSSSLWGTIISAGLLIFIPSFILAYTNISYSWWMILVFSVSAIILSFYPSGIISNKIRNS